MIVIAAHHWYHDAIGGAFRLATEFAEHLAAEGREVAYVCCEPGARPPALRESREHGVRIWRYSLPASAFSWQRLRGHQAGTAAAVKRLANLAPVTHLCGHSPLQYRGALQALQGSTTLCQYTVHSPFDEELRHHLTGRATLAKRFKVQAAYRVERKNIAASQQVQTMSEFTLTLLKQKHERVLADKGIVTGGWVNGELFRPAAPRSILRQSLPAAWQTELPIFFCVRRLEPRMGVEQLIQAAAELRQIGLNFRVVIGGSGSQSDCLEQQVRHAGLLSTVHLVGRIPEAQLPHCYAAADCFVLPTRALECFGLIVLEAYAAGIPVIASDAAAIPELVRQVGREWLYPAGDAGQLAERMRAFLAGALRPAIDVTTLARRYDRSVMLRRWTELLDASAPANLPSERN